jgi:hypothetical protein
MSLPIFHFVFISLSTLLSLGFAYRSFNHFFMTGGNLGDLLLGILSIAGGLFLFVYGNRFFRKMKSLRAPEKTPPKTKLNSIASALITLGLCQFAFEISSYACSACMRGASGLTVSAVNGGIITMLLVIVSILAGFGIFFLVLIKRQRMFHK